MSGIRLRWIEPAVDRKIDIRVPGLYDEVATATVREWWKAFKRNSHPDVVANDDTSVIRQDGTLLWKHEAWQLFHMYKDDDPIILDIRPNTMRYTIDPDACIFVQCQRPCSTITLLCDNMEYERTLFPTTPFKTLFFTHGLPVGMYTIIGTECTFEITSSISSDMTLMDFDIPLLNPVAPERVKRSWELCAQILEHRGKRRATDAERQSFVQFHNQQGVSFCIDPLDKERLVCWRSEEFIQIFGADTYWLQVEHERYEELILAILQRTQPICSFSVQTLGQIWQYDPMIIYAPGDAEHALFIGIWIPHAPETGINMLQSYFQNEMKSPHRPFKPISFRTLEWFHYAYRLFLKGSGFRTATSEEITQAVAAYSNNEHLTILDITRSLEDSIVYQSERTSAIFAKWPPVELTGAQLKQFWNGAEYLEYRAKTISGEIVLLRTRFIRWNTATQLVICLAQWV